MLTKVINGIALYRCNKCGEFCTKAKMRTDKRNKNGLRALCRACNTAERNRSKALVAELVAEQEQLKAESLGLEIDWYEQERSRIKAAGGTEHMLAGDIDLLLEGVMV